MKPLRVADASTIVLGLQDEIGRSEESRYDRRLHAPLLVAQGMRYPGVVRLLGDGPRTYDLYFSSLDEVVSAAVAPFETWSADDNALNRLCAIT